MWNVPNQLLHLSINQIAFCLCLYSWLRYSKFLSEKHVFLENSDGYRDSWMPKMPRISDEWGLSTKQIIYTTLSKSHGTQWTRCKRQKKKIRTAAKSHALDIIYVIMNYLCWAWIRQALSTVSHEWEGIHRFHLLLMNHWLLMDTGRGVVIVFSSIITGELTMLHG